MLQGAGPAGRQRVLPAGEPAEEGLRREPAGGGAADLARGAGQPDAGCSWKSRTGSKGRAGRGSFPESVPFPSPANDAFTPFTTPSSKSRSSAAGCACTSPTSAGCPTAGSRSTSATSTSNRRPQGRLQLLHENRERLSFTPEDDDPVRDHPQRDTAGNGRPRRIDGAYQCPKNDRRCGRNHRSLPDGESNVFPLIPIS